MIIGFAVFGMVCAAAIVAGLGLFIYQISKNGWNN